MTRTLLLLMLALLLAVCAVSATSQTIILNGEKVSATYLDKDGKPYADILTLIQLLGGKATYDKVAKKLYITLPPQTTSGTKGTNELAGTWAKLDTVYTIGKAHPLYITLKSVEYTIARVSVGPATFIPDKSQKLLILRYTIQNPQKEEVLYNWNSLHFTAIDDKNVNYEYVQEVGDANTRARVDISLKPAQKTEAYTIFLLPASVVIPKIMIQANNDDTAPVLRYDPTKDVKALAAPFADPADKTGVLALGEVTAVVGTSYPYGNCDVNVEKAEIVTKAINGEELEEGARFCVLTVSCKNQGTADTVVNWNTFKPQLRTTDGDDLEYNQTLLLGTADREADLTVKPGEEVKVRYYYAVGKDITLKSFSLAEGDDGRIFTYDMSKVK